MNSTSGIVTVRRFLVTVAIAAIGGWLFHLAGLPAAWLSGGMVLVAVMTLAGVPTVMPAKVRDGLFVLLGISMGAGVRPEVVDRIGEWPLSMAFLLVAVICITAAGYTVLRYIAHWPKETAFFGAIPGTLSYVIALATERGADLPRIASTQSVRLFVLVALLPYALMSTNGTQTSLAETVLEPGLQDYLIGAPLCVLASVLAVAARVPGGWMTGAFLMSAGLNASGLVTLALPGPLMLVCFMMMGALIGCRFNEMTFREFLRVLMASIAAFTAAFATSVLFATAVSHMMEIPFGQALLAFAPGGLEVMTLLAFMLDLDPAFVAAHQIVRFTGMVLLLPWVTSLFFWRTSPSQN
ncbi:AbrB family transcriptional regulator [Labrenzia sp. PHM005]|uniref:AbrB family transcriptional regulator n=1 Tax=Labrenzia sp. PHM005 TaxID=2590016 RepID=UPI00114069C0|nr:AbrB family transcriptional regulator [Labrenzia sp. PHM005]QDG78788.1 AbrB family transcriptional regulator [Labrenzia sp. PHM005]